MFRKYAVLLAFGLAFAACARNGSVSVKPDGGGPAAQGVPRGRYVEADWTPPALSGGRVWIQSVCAEGGGFGALLSDGESYTSYWSADGKDWAARDASALEALSARRDENTDILMARGDKGGYLAFVTQPDPGADGGASFSLRYADPDGQLRETPLPPDGFPPVDMRVGPDGGLYFLIIEGGVRAFPPEGGSAVSFPQVDDRWAVGRDRLAAYAREDNSIVFYDLQTQDERERVPLAQGMISPGGHAPALAFDGQGGLYACGSSGVYRLAPGGTLFERVVDGAACSLGMPSFQVGEIAMGAGDMLLVSMVGAEGGRLLGYRYNKDIPTLPEKELAITSLEEIPTVRQAAIAFQMAHPDVRVATRVLRSADNPLSIPDGIRTLNTALLAGKGPDVLVLDGLPWAAYAEKGVLLDLRGVADALLKRGDLLPKVAGAFGSGGAAYAIPARFRLPCLLSTPENIGRAGSLAALASRAREEPGKRLFYDIAPESLLRLFTLSCAPAWLSEDGLDTVKFVNFLEDIKALSENTAGVDFSADLSAEQPAGESFIREWTDEAARVRAAFGKVEYYTANLAGFSHFSGILPVVQTRMGSAYRPERVGEVLSPLPGQAGNIFEPVCILGINARSGQTALAKGFVETALSEQVQGIDLRDGFAVNTRALPISFDRRENYYASVTMEDGDRLESRRADIPAQEVLAALFATLETPVQFDNMLHGIIVEETAGYFRGEITAHEAAAAVGGRVQAYLTE